MAHDIFGNLRDWGGVLERIEALAAQHQLDGHQAGLVRILRYRDNWRLCESVLEYVKDLRQPTDQLLRGVLSIMMDESIYHDARILAAEALATLTAGAQARGDSGAAVDSKIALQKMGELLNTPAPPFFHRAIDGIRETLESSAKDAQETPKHPHRSESNAR